MAKAFDLKPAEPEAKPQVRSHKEKPAPVILTGPKTHHGTHSHSHHHVVSHEPKQAELSPSPVVPVDESDFQTTFEPELTRESGRRVAWLNIILFLGVLFVGSLVAKAAYTTVQTRRTETMPTSTVTPPAPSPSATPLVEPTPSPSPSTSPSSSPAPSPSPSPSASPSPTVLPPSEVHVQVLNGTGRRGDASYIASQLRNAGYTHVTFGNAASYTYQKTVIYYQADRKAEAEAVGAVLSGRTLVYTEANLTVDVQVVVGRT